MNSAIIKQLLYQTFLASFAHEKSRLSDNTITPKLRD